MLHTKFRRNRPTGFWKEDFKCYTIDGHGHVTGIILMNFNFVVP